MLAKDAWRAHYQGGRTGYVIVDAGRMLIDAAVRSGTSFEWFATVPGAKIAELTILYKDGFKMVSSQAPWPTRPISIGDRIISLPDIYEL